MTASTRVPADLLAALDPERLPGTYVVNAVDTLDGIDPTAHRALVREPEGWTLVTQRRAAARLGLDTSMPFVAITLTVASELTAVGLMAAVSTALAEAGIACNVLAGLHHDHLLVPAEDADRALACLDALQQAHRPTSARTEAR